MKTKITKTDIMSILNYEVKKIVQKTDTSNINSKYRKNINDDIEYDTHEFKRKELKKIISYIDENITKKNNGELTDETLKETANLERNRIQREIEIFK